MSLSSSKYIFVFWKIMERLVTHSPPILPSVQPGHSSHAHPGLGQPRHSVQLCPRWDLAMRLHFQSSLNWLLPGSDILKHFCKGYKLSSQKKANGASQRSVAEWALLQHRPKPARAEAHQQGGIAAGGGRARPASRAPRKHWQGATSRERLPGSCICVHAKPGSVFITAAGSRVPRLHGKQETMLHLKAAASA